MKNIFASSRNLGLLLSPVELSGTLCSEKVQKSDFGGLGPAPVSLGDFYARKPQKWAFQIRIWSETIIIATAHTTFMLVTLADESHDVKIVMNPSNKDQGIKLTGRSTVMQNHDFTMGSLLAILQMMSHIKN